MSDTLTVAQLSERILHWVSINDVTIAWQSDVSTDGPVAYTGDGIRKLYGEFGFQYGFDE